ncbi:MAG: Lrp/AsnC family transcriptional regulator [Chloroflexi bacterium]|nr:Lrp/AsnC family transcriptional regulator [Chloroflexota bacterium]
MITFKFSGWGKETLAERAKIDETDAKILRILLLESRTSFTDIAEECEITVTAVRMRYKRLWKEGVINGEKMLVNPHCLGYHHIVDLFITNAFEDEKKVAKFLESKPYIAGLVGPFGNYNFFGKVALRDFKKLHEIIEEFESDRNIKHVDALIWAKAANIEYPQNLVIKPLKRENKQQNKKVTLSNPDQGQAVLELDEIDKKIAKILSEKSRTPFKKIAVELDISSKTVIQRYKKLRENLFTFSSVTLDLSKLGYKALANLYIKVSNRSKMNEIYAQLLEIPNIIVIIRLIGSYDLYCALVLEDFEQMFEADDKIRKISGIETTTSYLTRLPSSWPLNLFPSLIDNESIQPKYWH